MAGEEPKPACERSIFSRCRLGNSLLTFRLTRHILPIKQSRVAHSCVSSATEAESPRCQPGSPGMRGTSVPKKTLSFQAALDANQNQGWLALRSTEGDPVFGPTQTWLQAVDGFVATIPVIHSLSVSRF